MVRFGVTRARIALLATLVALSGAWWHADATVWTLADASGHQPTVEASTLVASLPANLTPPLEPGQRLVAMVASDIDADGDLDLVASDGSLDLIVWINDGTGHLTRRYAHPSGGWSQDASTADSDSRQASVSAVTSGSISLGSDSAVLFALRDEREPGTTYASPDLDSFFARSQSPRAPPLPRLSL